MAQQTSALPQASTTQTGGASHHAGDNTLFVTCQHYSRPRGGIHLILDGGARLLPTMLGGPFDQYGAPQEQELMGLGPEILRILARHRHVVLIDHHDCDSPLLRHLAQAGRDVSLRGAEDVVRARLSLAHPWRHRVTVLGASDARLRELVQRGVSLIQAAHEAAIAHGFDINEKIDPARPRSRVLAQSGEINLRDLPSFEAGHDEAKSA